MVPAPILPWAEKITSDGLPFSQSIDNPDSLLAQLKAEREYEVIAAQRKPREIGYAGWAPQAITYSSINE